MQRIYTTLFAMLFIQPVFAADYEIDPSHTYPHFQISHLGFSTLHGRFDSTTGSLTFDQQKREGSVTITIDANSINTGHKKRDDHLRSPDFLNTAEFPTITFKSTKVEFVGNNKAEITGKLNLMGVTKEVTLDVHHMKCGTHPFNQKQVCGFDATATIKRSDFGSKYGIPAIGDEMKLTFEVEATKK